MVAAAGRSDHAECVPEAVLPDSLTTREISPVERSAACPALPDALHGADRRF